MTAPATSQELRRFALFKSLSDDVLEAIWRKTSIRPTSADERISSGNLQPFIGFSWSGAYRIVIGARGHELTLRTIQTGQHFGEVPAFAALPDLQYELVVDRPGVIVFVDREWLANLIVRTPELSRGALTSIAQAAVLRADRLFEFATMDVRLRIMAEIVRLSHGAIAEDNALVIRPAPTHQVMAAQVGTTREGVTRHLRRLTREGYIRARRGAIHILRFAELRAEVEEAVGPRPTYTLNGHDKPQ